MILPSTHIDKTEWIFLGPLPSKIPSDLSTLPVMAIDGGANFNSSPDIWVGDADSCTDKVNIEHCFTHPKEKDQSDLGLGLSFFKEKQKYRFHFFGFLGGRHDHELFNFGEAASFLENHEASEILFYSEKGEPLFRFVSGGQWSFVRKGTFSLGAIKESTVTLSGHCQYHIPKGTKVSPLSSYGLSNEGSGEIYLETTQPMFIYFPESTNHEA